MTRIHSVAGLHAGGLIVARPFRAPHHTISPSGLAGGGSPPRPGEATLAHHGVLFLDELSEFQRSSLDALRQPLEDGNVTIVRGAARAAVPDPVHAGRGDQPVPVRVRGRRDGDRCTCGEAELRRHRRRLSGPLLDRMDLRDRRAAPLAPMPCAPRRRRARPRSARAWRRLASASAGAWPATGARCNGEMDARTVQRLVRLDDDAERELGRAYAAGMLSARGRHRVLRVARTIADLGERERGLARRRADAR